MVSNLWSFVRPCDFVNTSATMSSVDSTSVPTSYPPPVDVWSGVGARFAMCFKQTVTSIHRCIVLFVCASVMAAWLSTRHCSFVEQVKLSNFWSLTTRWRLLEESSSVHPHSTHNTKSFNRTTQPYSPLGPLLMEMYPDSADNIAITSCNWE